MRLKWNNRPKWLRYGIVVVLIHIIGLLLLVPKAQQYPQIIGFGFLAYTLGLRHAFDADHIAAIDNTVRKLIQQKEDPTGIGFFFSLGHSSVVFIMAILTALSMKWAQAHVPQLKVIGSIIGTTVSGAFLVLIGVLNLIIWFDVYKIFVEMRKGKCDKDNLDQLLLNRGFISRFFSSLYRFINKSYHVYPLGFLFGLGFDTASEVALLAISVNAVTQSIPFSVIISLPLLFAAGMSLMDTSDGIFMTTAYNWAFATPMRKIYYNLSITGLSVVAALFIGIIELIQIITIKLGLDSGFWGWIQNLSFGGIGYFLAALFVLTWAFSYFLWRFLKLENS
jgi:high-affinity nickel-transport protein